jgi:hypothetical protein
VVRTSGGEVGVALSNVDAERAVVGCLLIDPGFAAAHVKRLQPEDFCDAMARAIVRAYLEAAADPIEISTRAAEATGESIARTLAYATEQMASVPSAAGVETYVGLVLEAAERRRGLTVISQAGGRLMQGRSWNEVSVWLAGQLKERRTAAEDRPMPAVIADLYSQVEAWPTARPSSRW